MAFFTRKTIRRCVQAGTAVAFMLIPYLNFSGVHFIKGNLLSLDIGGLVLADPLAALQTIVSSWEISVTLLAAAAIPLLLAFVLGSVFCSWLCPYGLFSELVHAARFRMRPAAPKRIFRTAFLPRAAAVGVLLFGVAFFGMPPLLNQISMPGWYTRLMQGVWLQHAVPLAGAAMFFGLLSMELITGKRIWCRYICPQSVLLIVMQRIAPYRWRLVHDRQCCTCRGESPCITSCSLGLNPKGTPKALEGLCNNCGDCVAVCSRHGGALQQRFSHRQ